MGVQEILEPVRMGKTGGYKVDVSRGELNGRVSSEWFNRLTLSGICRSTISGHR